STNSWTTEEKNSKETCKKQDEKITNQSRVLDVAFWLASSVSFFKLIKDYITNDNAINKEVQDTYNLVSVSKWIDCPEDITTDKQEYFIQDRLSLIETISKADLKKI